MESVTVVEKIQKCVDLLLEANREWHFVLVKADHMGESSEYICCSVNFENADNMASIVRGMLNEFMKKWRSCESFESYNTVNARNVGMTLSLKDAAISENWDGLTDKMLRPSNNDSISEFISTAFVFYTDICVGGVTKTVYLISGRNPIKCYDKSSISKRLLALRKNVIGEISEPIVQLGSCFDAIAYDGILYMLNFHCETLFDLGKRNEAIRTQCFEIIDHSGIVEDMESFRAFESDGRRVSIFNTFNEGLIKDLADEEKRARFVALLHLSCNAQGQIVLDTKEKAKIFTDAVCDRTTRELLNDNLCSVPYVFRANSNS